MASNTEIGPETAIAATAVPRAVRRHALVCLLAAGVLLGGALRFVPADDATASPSGDTGQEVAGSTACAAT
jgi:hypothetical protein